MSVHVMSWVLRHSEEKLGRRLVLLALADSAEEDGGNAWPSVATLMTKTRLSERQVQYALRGLEKAEAISREGRHRSSPKQRYGTHVYRVHMKGAIFAPLEDPKGAIFDTQRVQPTAPEPSLGPVLGPTPNGVGRLLADDDEPPVNLTIGETPSLPVNGDAAETAPQTAQTVIQTVVDALATKEIPISGRHRGMLGKQARDLLDSGFSFEVVTLACVTAIRRGEPQNAHFIAGDLVTAQAGARLTRREYEKALQDEMEISHGST